MNCTEFEKLVDAYVDHELQTGIEEIEEHINNCEACKELYEETLAIKAMLSSLDEIDLPDDFETSLHERLVEETSTLKKETPVVIPFYKRSRTIKTIGSIAAVGIVSLLLLNVDDLMPSMGSDNNESVMLESAEDMNDMANVAFSEEPVEMAADDMASDDAGEIYFDESTEEASDYTANAYGDSEDASVEEAPLTLHATAKTTVTTMYRGSFVEEVVDYTLAPTDIDPVVELVNEYDINDLEVFGQMISFYITKEESIELGESLSVDFTIVNEQQLLFTEGIENTLNQYQASLDDKDSEDETKRTEFEMLEEEAIKIESYKGLKQINIYIEEK